MDSGIARAIVEVKGSRACNSRDSAFLSVQLTRSRLLVRAILEINVSCPCNSLDEGFSSVQFSRLWPLARAILELMAFFASER